MSIAEWIRNHLLEVKEDYPYNMWKIYVKETGFLRCSYGSFRTNVWWLKKSGLITKTRTLKKKDSPIRRNYYAATAKGSKVNSIVWRSAYKAYRKWK